MSWLFEEPEYSQLYSKYIPPYPDCLYKLVTGKLQESFSQLDKIEDRVIKAPGQSEHFGKKWKLALDVGCGTGGNTLSLVDYFQETFGIDSSESQIYEAKKNYGNRDPSKVTFLCHDASKISQLVSESSVDLVTVAQALHWFDRPKFYEECLKVLRPGGLLAAYGFDIHKFSDPKFDQIIHEFYYGTIRGCNDPRMFHVKERFAQIYPEFVQYFSSSERDDSLVLSVESTLEDYVGYLRTFPPYVNYRQLNPDRDDPLQVLYNRFIELGMDSSSTVKYRAIMFVLFGRKA